MPEKFSPYILKQSFSVGLLELSLLKIKYGFFQPIKHEKQKNFERVLSNGASRECSNINSSLIPVCNSIKFVKQAKQQLCTCSSLHCTTTRENVQFSRWSCLFYIF